MNFEEARINMLKQQFRAWLVLDNQLLAIIKQLPREKLVPSAYLNLAYADTAIQMPGGQAMLPPKEAGRAIQALALKPDEKALVVGAHDAYIMAVIAHQVLQVYAVDHNQALRASQQQALESIDIRNVSMVEGNADQGWQQNAPYDAVFLAGSVASVSENLLKSLTIGGRLFAIVGDAPAMAATVYTRELEDKWSKSKLFETSHPRLSGATDQTLFQF